MTDHIDEHFRTLITETVPPICAERVPQLALPCNLPATPEAHAQFQGAHANIFGRAFNVAGLYLVDGYGVRDDCSVAIGQNHTLRMQRVPPPSSVPVNWTNDLVPPAPDWRHAVTHHAPASYLIGTLAGRASRYTWHMLRDAWAHPAGRLYLIYLLLQMLTILLWRAFD